MRRPTSWWSERSQVERVALYTRQSLYLLLWGFPGAILLQMSSRDDFDGPATALVLLLSLLLGVAATRCLQAALELYPASGPLPVRQIALLVVPALVASGLATVAPLGDAARGGAVMVCWGFAVMGLGGFRDRRLLVATALAGSVLPAVAAGQWMVAPVLLVAALFLIFTLQASLWLYGVVSELDRARSAQAALAVAEERLRFSRDLHDVLGRRLSTIAVQAELAATLSRRGDPDAPMRMLDVRAVAHEALRETRELARGYRATDLAQELEGARALLRSAGIDCVADTERLPAAWHEAAGWVVREAVTNVLRHSTATTVWIGYDGHVLSVVNDRPNPTAGSAGTGLVGLRERLAPLGARLRTENDGEHFRLTVTIPTEAPEEAP